MKLIEYFKKLESIAFGPWLSKYKKLFTLKELESDMFEVILKAQEDNKHSNKELVIVYNDIIEREIGEKELLNVNQSKVVNIFTSNHKENLYYIFTWLTSFQLEQYSKFILNLPADYRDYRDYFSQEEQQDGYSKTKAFSNIQDKELLNKKYLSSLKNESYDNNYSLFQENTVKLQKYLEYPYEYNTTIYKPEFLGSVDSYYNYFCDNI